jgi:hypothetical protein
LLARRTSAVIQRQYPDEFCYLSRLPLGLQKALFTPLAPLGQAGGYRAGQAQTHYERPHSSLRRPSRRASALPDRTNDEPEANGLRPLRDTAAVAAWEPDSDLAERLGRLRDRRVLDAAGFLLHVADEPV